MGAGETRTVRVLRKIMNKHLLLYFTLIIFLSISCTREISLLNLKGIWINKKYLETLKKTHSPYLAIETKKVYMPYIEISENGISWLNYFHDGDGYPITRLAKGDSIFKFNIISPQDKIIDEFILNDSNNIFEITWITSIYKDWTDHEKGQKIIKQNFVKIDKSIQEYFNDILFVGSYVDSLGNTYEFTKNMIANWPNNKFKYEIQLDYSFSNTDCILNLTEDLYDDVGGYKTYGFKFSGNYLILFDEIVINEFQTKYKAKPFLKLKRVYM